MYILDDTVGKTPVGLNNRVVGRLVDARIY